MTNRAIRVFLAAILSMTLSGCIMLPVPNCRVEGLGVASQVVDAETGQPVSGARVAATGSGSQTVVTNADGRFKLDRHMQWHAGYLYGVIGYPIWPFTGDCIAPCRTIRVCAKGYEESEFTLLSWPAPAGDGNTIGDIPIKDDVLLPPSLSIRRRAQTNPPQ